MVLIGTESNCAPSTTSTNPDLLLKIPVDSFEQLVTSKVAQGRRVLNTARPREVVKNRRCNPAYANGPKSTPNSRMPTTALTLAVMPVERAPERNRLTEANSTV